ncbi:hypothetical protein FAM3257_01919 [Lacticaseibacillus paracasei]|nr:hypothetical protein FAM3257_01919 [Lacticaseibacillus paracasei]
MLRRSLITFALVVSGLLITTAAGTTILGRIAHKHEGES